MTAPEDQNGLREALARAEAERDDWRSQWEEMAELVCEFAAEKAPDALALVGADRDQCLRRALAAEAEITRLKEGMEAADPRVIAAAWKAWHARHGGKIGPGPAFVEAIRAGLACLATLEPKEQSHG